jgi:MATE family multidrug resistance protein
MSVFGTQTPDRSIGIGDIIRISWPLTISMLSFTAMSLADTLFVSWLGTTHLAAIGLASITTFAFTAMGMGLLAGIKILTGLRTGESPGANTGIYLWQAIWIAAGLGLIGLTISPLAQVGFRLLSSNPEIQLLGATYLQIRLLGAPFTLLLVGLDQWYQGRGDTRTPMVAIVSANVLNICMDPVLIFGLGPIPALGMKGAALATLLSWAVGAVGLLIYSRKHLKKSRPELRTDILWKAINLGLPLAFQRVLGVFGFLLFSVLLGMCGDAHLAAHVMVIRVVSVSFLPGHAIGEGASILVSQRLGAGREDQSREAWGAANRLALIIMCSCAIAFIGIPDLFMQPFQVEPEVAAIGRQLLLIAGIFQIFDALAMVGLSALAGAGDTRFSMMITVSSLWLINLPFAALFAVGLGMGAPGAWIAMTFEIALIAGLSAWRIYTGRWTALTHRRKLSQKL